MLKDIIKSQDRREFVSQLVFTMILIIVNMFLLRYIWNNALVKHVTIFQPIESLLDAFLMSVGITMLRQ
jgi:hypothetical protein